MFTNNYIRSRYNAFFGVNYDSAITSPFGKITFKAYIRTNGSYTYPHSSVVYDIGAAMNTPRCQEISTSTTLSSTARTNHMGVYFGTGSTPALLEDYTLESPITTGLAFAGGIEKVPAYENGKAEAVASYIVTNTSGAEINIWEIGCFVPTQDGSNTSSYTMIMLERTVLTEPITIPPGESKMVTYKVAFNQTLSVD